MLVLVSISAREHNLFYSRVQVYFTSMVKAAKVKGMAAKALQSKAQEHTSLPPAYPKEMHAPPPPSKEQPASSSCESKSRAAVPRPKQTAADLQNSISDASGLPASDVKKLLNALRDVIAKNLRNHGKFQFASMVRLRAKATPAREARTRSLFGKEIVLKPRPAGLKITATAIKSFTDTVTEES